MGCTLPIGDTLLSYYTLVICYRWEDVKSFKPSSLVPHVLYCSELFIRVLDRVPRLESKFNPSEESAYHILSERPLLLVILNCNVAMKQSCRRDEDGRAWQKLDHQSKLVKNQVSTLLGIEMFSADNGTDSVALVE